MKPQDKQLVKKLAVVLVIKMVVLTALWRGFVRKQRVVVAGCLPECDWLFCGCLLAVVNELEPR